MHPPPLLNNPSDFLDNYEEFTDQIKFILSVHATRLRKVALPLDLDTSKLEEYFETSNFAFPDLKSVEFFEPTSYDLLSLRQEWFEEVIITRFENAIIKGLEFLLEGSPRLGHAWSISQCRRLPAAKQRDVIRINDLLVTVLLSSGTRWSKESTEPVDQPISISLSIFYDISQAAQTDDLSHSLNYAEVAKAIRGATTSKTFRNIQDISRRVSDIVFQLLTSRGASEIHVRIVQLKGALHCKSIAVEHLASLSEDGNWRPKNIAHHIEGLTFPVIVGVNAAERLEKQDLVVNMSIATGTQGLSPDDWIEMRSVTSQVYEAISSTSFLTLEALTSFIASRILSMMLSYQTSPVISVRAAKPSALVFAESAEVQIVRTFDDYPELSNQDHDKKTNLSSSKTSQSPRHAVAIALGSNLGDSFRNIEFALRLLESPHDILVDDDGFIGAEIDIIDTSFLYETAPMYVTDQPSFINCACMVETSIPPRTLLALLKAIESKVGRVPSTRNGPRAVDLDIIFYDSEVIDTRSVKENLDNLDGELVVPHPRVQEREFVLRPLNDMIADYVHPVLKKSVQTLFNEIYDPIAPPMNKIIPFPRTPIFSAPPTSSIDPVPDTLTHWLFPSANTPSSIGRKASPGKIHMMATLNVTPDSFSDGSTHNVLPAALAYVKSSIAAGATIIDIGGYSTRPGAAFVPVDEEIARVVPAIEAIRDRKVLSESTTQEGRTEEELLRRVVDTPISVDTFRWEVAEAAIKAGANCINDVCAFSGPDSWPPAPAGIPEGDRAAEYMTKLKAITRKHAVPVVLMHSRGDAGKNKDYSSYDYAIGGSVLEGVRIELGAKVDRIVKGKGGVRRWFVIVDPGIGFSKTLEGNLEVLRSAKDIVANRLIGDVIRAPLYRNPLRGYPQLIGASRKTFLGVILAQGPDGRETKPKERTWATAAAVTCAVQQDALVVRVHDVKAMADVVRVAHALWS
ncbi:unnamed protein product [Cyclocybe aegerita]|uniref:Pterin-binding domain-containing protein n=1 Tax=Cyclocybe aegerita TaxID=1973307 RepID=A0A8S0WAM5_CYCAE|nr:unnamed protein product [Cyclocybe aegerita]